jgi:16S rRNA (guanine1516-N2)-methyltransferase
MPVTFLKDSEPLENLPPLESELAKKLKDFGKEISFEWRGGQYWLCSPDPKENSIGIEIDETLRRHEKFFHHHSLKDEVLARAIGIKNKERPHVLDLTAGLLGDTLLFLAFGCQVTAVERHPIVAFLIQSALKNARHEKIENLEFVESDAAHYLENTSEEEVVFFDPMYEDANQKSSPKKEMRIFREVIGKDLDAKSIFTLAENKARRLVVKRPRLSEALSDKKAVEFKGKATRYDVYFPFGSNPLK